MCTQCSATDVVVLQPMHWKDDRITTYTDCRPTDLGAVSPVLCQWWWAGGTGLTRVDVGHSHEPSQSAALLLQLTEELVSSLLRCGPIAYPVHPRLSLWIAGEYVVAGVSGLFLGEPQGAPLSLLSGGTVLGGVGERWLLHACMPMSLCAGYSVLIGSRAA